MEFAMGFLGLGTNTMVSFPGVSDNREGDILDFKFEDTHDSQDKTNHCVHNEDAKTKANENASCA